MIKEMNDSGDGHCLEKLKENYEKFKGKYILPDFYELNKLFDIEEIDPDTDFLLRKIRRTISERVAAYSRFIEVILNPSNAPIFFFKLIKKLGNKDKEVLSEIYETIGNIEVEVLALDLDYDEKKESDFIKRVYILFNEDLRLKFFDVIRKLGDEENLGKKETNGSYFG